MKKRYKVRAVIRDEYKVDGVYKLPYRGDVLILPEDFGNRVTFVIDSWSAMEESFDLNTFSLLELDEYPYERAGDEI